MHEVDVTRVFTFNNNESARYGNSNFGAACITARNLVRANLGTRFLQRIVGGWDRHANIYGGGLNAANANSVGRTFEAGLATLIAGLKTEGLLERTRPLSAAGSAGGRRGSSRRARAGDNG